ncbi:hypothetical protein LINGRAHAP2_LOCUS31355 [Linum grandiflorum]
MIMKIPTQLDLFTFLIQNHKPCKGLYRVSIARYDDLAIIYGNSGVTRKGARGQALVSSKLKNKRRRVSEVEAEADSVSVGREIIAELKPMMEVSTASLGDALRGETVVEQESVQDELVRMRNDI